MPNGDLPRWPRLTDEDIAAVVTVLRSNRLSQTSGTAVGEFEAALAAYHGVAHAIAVSSGTAAVHLALAALDAGPGDEIIVPAHTFVGSASPIVYQGATVVFADVDPRTFCLDPESVRKLLNERTKAVIAVHLNGCPADIAALRAITDEAGCALVEDAAQALGAAIGSRRVGTFGRFACLSLWEEKVITSGEGGVVLTDDDAAAARIRRLRMHGEGPIVGDERVYWSHEIGYNYRLTAIQAALGLSQLRRVDEFVAARRANARYLAERLAGLPLELPVEPPGSTHSFWKFAVRATDGIPARTIVPLLRAQGVPAAPRYPFPLHHQPAFARFATTRLPVAERLSDELFTLPVHPALDRGHLDRIAAAVGSCLAASVAGSGSSR